MLVRDSNDPTGLGLFSKCARNQAYKSTGKRPRTAHNQSASAVLNVSSDWISGIKLKGKKSDVSFIGRQESREQRERKFKKEQTPAVGQYNPVLKERPRLVWDFMKATQLRQKRISQLNKTEVKNSKTFDYKPAMSSDGKEPEHFDQSLSNSSKNMGQNERQHKKDAVVTQQNFTNTNLDGPSSRLKKRSKQGCIVNMSRSTGREHFETLNHIDQYDNVSNPDYDLSKSVCRVRPRTAKNIYFSKQFNPREVEKVKMTGGPASYNNLCMDMVKPKAPQSLNWELLPGRKDIKTGSATALTQYYDFDDYVWKSSSKVFPNTKTHLVTFVKQTNRYDRKRL